MRTVHNRKFPCERLRFDELRSLNSGRNGASDTPCPLCGPSRKSARNRSRKVLRIWDDGDGFITYTCARCQASGWASEQRSGKVTEFDRVKIERAKAEAAERQGADAAARLEKAKWLWSKRQPIAGSIAETYQRSARCYTGPLPLTLGFLPERGRHPPAQIAAFGIPEEIEPGVLTICDDALRGVHITRLAPDGLSKAGTDVDKIMLGSSIGSPVVLASVNDLLGLVITEGIENALSVHEATGLGAWAAGSASRLPALAQAVPGYVEVVTIVVDDDYAGWKNSAELAARLKARGTHAELCQPRLRSAA